MNPEDRREEWNTSTLHRDFAVIAWSAGPFVVVRRRSDLKVGVLQFDHYPRVYYNWQEKA